MIFLNALSHDFFTPIREQLEGLITSTKDGVDFDGLISRLHYEAQKHCTAATEEVHAVLAKKTPSSHPTCSNCGKSGHTIENCWKPGGGNEGGGTRFHLKKKKDAAIILAANTNTIGSNPKSTVIQSTESTHIGMHTRSLTSFYSQSDCMCDGNWSCTLVDDKCNVYWTPNTNNNALALISSSYIPHFIDSGTSIHCSPCKSDFTELNAAPLCSIKGINSSIIMAIGVGNIILHSPSGNKFTLHGVLYVPDAAIHLISVGKLADTGLTSPS